jgi:hypothetical protein
MFVDGGAHDDAPKEGWRKEELERNLSHDFGGVMT